MILIYIIIFYLRLTWQRSTWIVPVLVLMAARSYSSYFACALSALAVGHDLTSVLYVSACRHSPPCAVSSISPTHSVGT